MVVRNGGLAMGVFAKSAIGFGLFKPIAKLLGAGIVFWLLVATYGLDLSPGFF